MTGSSRQQRRSCALELWDRRFFFDGEEEGELPTPPVCRCKWTQVLQHSAIAGLHELSVQHLPASQLAAVLAASLPELRSLRLHLDFTSYNAAALAAGLYADEQALGFVRFRSQDGLQSGCSWRSEGGLRLLQLPLLTRLSLTLPHAHPAVLAWICCLPALSELRLEVESVTRRQRWQRANIAQEQLMAQLQADRQRTLQDVDLLRLLSLPCLRRLELVGLEQLTAAVLPVLACLHQLQELSIARWRRHTGSGSQRAHCNEAQEAEALCSNRPLLALHRLELKDCAALPSYLTERLRLQLTAWSSRAEWPPVAEWPPSFVLATAQHSVFISTAARTVGHLRQTAAQQQLLTSRLPRRAKAVRAGLAQRAWRWLQLLGLLLYWVLQLRFCCWSGSLDSVESGRVWKRMVVLFASCCPSRCPSPSALRSAAAALSVTWRSASSSPRCCCCCSWSAGARH